MRILFVNQFFWPDVAPTGQLLGDVADHLSRLGHEVTVICSGGAYVEGGRAGFESTDEPSPAIKILRVPGFTYQRRASGRLFSYLTFLLGALWYELRIPRQDLVVTMTTPPLLAVGGRILKFLRRTRHFIWEMDLFPGAFVAVGAIAEGSRVTQLLRWIEDSCRRQSDGVIALGLCMRQRLLARGISPHLVHIAENWADGKLITPSPTRTYGPVNVFYSGNLGLAHDIDTIANVMRHFRNDPRFVFTFAGGGVGRSQLERLCSTEGIDNARFLPYSSRKSMGEHLAQADIGLVTERATWIGTIVPSKVYGLMAAGRPVLFIGPESATPSLVINKFHCGWQVEPGDLPAVVALLEGLSLDRDGIHCRGRRARLAFEREYDMPHGVARVSKILLGITPESASREMPETVTSRNEVVTEAD
jgi:colanic acid biosynthesis glycosyl transferase WcaI